MLEIAVFPALSDNFGYLVRDTGSGRVAAIDAPEEGAILAELEKRGWTLTDILITHHHSDHTDAIAPLKRRFDAHVIGPREEASKIAGLDTLVGGGDTVTFGETVFEVFDVPGHTLGHIAFFSPADKALFSADALFSLGVGRMFEGDAESMWAGLERLKALPSETKIYCGHEYTLSNAKFALSVDPDNAALKTRADEARRQIDAGEPTIPARLSEELAANPFLRADTPDLARAMNLVGAPAWQVFGALRKAKDNF
ncbi:hydroxyacylglutathione hydrolase [Pelagibacterium mangrovi]|uniref:hydroxyacylglutathione hydrolase n=1 Tax=Pelagibacterium mangrovi TaxID=3119828 RepID=UPI002FC86BCD